jgi:hypothetical protein
MEKFHRLISAFSLIIALFIYKFADYEFSRVIFIGLAAIALLYDIRKILKEYNSISERLKKGIISILFLIMWVLCAVLSPDYFVKYALVAAFALLAIITPFLDWTDSSKNKNIEK